MNLARAASLLQNHKIYLSISLCTLSGAIIYTILKTKQRKGLDLGLGLRPTDYKKDGVDLIHKEKLIVENALISKLRPAIKDIEEQTNTSVTFSNVASVKQGTHQICHIIGDQGQVKMARALLLKEVERLTIVKEEIQVPTDLCLRNCDSEHEAVQKLCSLSGNAKFDANYCLERDIKKLKIVVSGTRKEVFAARKLIEDTIREWEKLNQAKNVPESAQQSQLYSKTNVQTISKAEQDQLNRHHHQQQQRQKHLFEVYISAIASPSKFWIQLVGQAANHLNELCRRLTEFYSQPQNRSSCHLQKPQFGQLVAVYYPRDGKWFRAEIVGAAANKANPKEILLDLFFVDYGNSEFVAPCHVYELHKQFTELSYQAAECFLANAISTIPNKPEIWEDDSTNYFEKITELLPNKKLICQVVTYKERTSSAGGRKRIVEVPGIELFYTQEGVVVNVGHAMIANGLARSSSASSQWSTVYDDEILQNKNRLTNKEAADADDEKYPIGASKNDIEFMKNSKKYMQHVNNTRMTTTTTSSYDEHFYATSKFSTITKQQIHCEQKGQEIVAKGM